MAPGDQARQNKLNDTWKKAQGTVSAEWQRRLGLPGNPSLLPPTTHSHGTEQTPLIGVVWPSWRRLLWDLVAMEPTVLDPVW